jgi:TetR/AcrR family transcriptional regulator
MSRPRAADHDLKRRAILDRSARLFADRGYARTSMSDIAAACGSSKVLIYHYYENKEQLLFDLLEAHFIKLEEAVKAADVPNGPPVERLRGLITALLAAYEGADALHKVQINELSALPASRQQELKAYERRLVDLFASALRDINPSLAKGNRLLKPVTMSLFGMINWSYLWFRPGGPISRAAYANLVTQIIVDGIARLGTDSPTRTRLRSKVTSL